MRNIKTKKPVLQLGKLLKTYKFYDQNGKRLAIFAVPELDRNVLHVYEVVCSAKDHFSKDVANIAFSLYMTSPAAAKIVSKVAVKEVGEIGYTEGMPKKAFLAYCKQWHFVMKNVKRVAVTPALMNNGVVTKYFHNKTRIEPQKMDDRPGIY